MCRSLLVDCFKRLKYKSSGIFCEQEARGIIRDEHVFVGRCGNLESGLGAACLTVGLVFKPNNMSTENTGVHDEFNVN